MSFGHAETQSLHGNGDGEDNVWSTPVVVPGDEDPWAQAAPVSRASPGSIEKSALTDFESTASELPQHVLSLTLDRHAELEKLLASVKSLKVHDTADDHKPVLDIDHAPLSIDQVRETWNRLVTIPQGFGKRRVEAGLMSGVRQEMTKILVAWRKGQEAKSSWEQRPSSMGTSLLTSPAGKTRESIGAGLFGWNLKSKEEPLLKRFSGVPPPQRSITPHRTPVRSAPRLAVSTSPHVTRTSHIATMEGKSTTPASAQSKPRENLQSPIKSPGDESFGQFQEARAALPQRQSTETPWLPPITPPASTTAASSSNVFEDLGIFDEPAVDTRVESGSHRTPGDDLLMLTPTTEQPPVVQLDPVVFTKAFGSRQRPQSEAGIVRKPLVRTVSDDFGEFQSSSPIHKPLSSIQENASRSIDKKELRQDRHIHGAYDGNEADGTKEEEEEEFGDFEDGEKSSSQRSDLLDGVVQPGRMQGRGLGRTLSLNLMD
ncbi:hypothetical protein PYCC9005_001584 [Savitreella phatthalungensis]